MKNFKQFIRESINYKINRKEERGVQIQVNDEQNTLFQYFNKEVQLKEVSRLMKSNSCQIVDDDGLWFEKKELDYDKAFNVFKNFIESNYDTSILIKNKFVNMLINNNNEKDFDFSIVSYTE